MFDTTFARDVQQTLDHFRRSVDQLFGSSLPGSGYSSNSNLKEHATRYRAGVQPACGNGVE
jgi:hypothetical protein